MRRLLAPYREGLRGIDRRVYLVVTMTLVSVASRMSLYTFLGIYFTRSVGLTLAIVGGAYLLENLGRGLAAPLAGAISDRVGRKPVLVASALATAAVLPGFLLVHDATTIFVWGGLLGLAQSGMWPATSALLMDLVPAERRQAVLGLNYTMLSLGYTIGVAPAGFLLKLGFGALAAASAAGFLLIGLTYLLALRRGRLPSTRIDRAERGGLARDLARAPRDPAFTLLAALGIVFPLGIGLIASVAPVYGKESGLDEGAIGLALAVNGPLLAALSIPVAAALSRHGPYRFLVYAAAVLALSYVPLAQGGGFWLLVLASVVFTAGELVFASALPVAVASLAPPGLRGAYQGAWTLVHAVGFGSALFLTGIVQPMWGWSITWVAWSALTLAAAVGLLFARPTFRRLADARAASSS